MVSPIEAASAAAIVASVASVVFILVLCVKKKKPEYRQRPPPGSPPSESISEFLATNPTFQPEKQSISLVPGDQQERRSSRSAAPAVMKTRKASRAADFRAPTQTSISVDHIGERVFVTGFCGGILRYFGTDHQFTHVIKCGVELDKPIGMMNGEVRPVRRAIRGSDS